MTCWQCGAPYPPDVGFCRACGAFVRPRNAPVNGPGATTAGALQVPVVAPPASGAPRDPRILAGRFSGNLDAPVVDGAVRDPIERFGPKLRWSAMS